MEQNLLELPITVAKEMSLILEGLIDKEIDTRTTFKHAFVDKNGKEVKNPTPKQIVDKGLNKIFDVQKTIFEPKLETTISELGVKYTKLKYFLDGTIHKYELQNSPEPTETEVVED